MATMKPNITYDQLQPGAGTLKRLTGAEGAAVNKGVMTLNAVGAPIPLIRLVFAFMFSGFSHDIF